MSNPKSSAQRVREPSPLGCNVPVMTHLAADERLSLVALAKQESRSIAATARMLIIEGMERRTGKTE